MVWILPCCCLLIVLVSARAEDYNYNVAYINHNYVSGNSSTDNFGCHAPLYTDITAEERSVLGDLYLMDMVLSVKILLLRSLNSSHYYFEYGTGGSTILSCRLDKKDFHMVAVESDKQWLSQLKQKGCLKSKEGDPRFSYHHADIGPTKMDKEWFFRRIQGTLGYPVDKKSKDLWENYSKSIIRYSPDTIDLVMIDGRFRIACALQSLLVTKPSTTIMIHDFFTRTHYHYILKYTDIIDCQHNMIVLRKKKDAVDKDIEIDFKRFLEDPR